MLAATAHADDRPSKTTIWHQCLIDRAASIDDNRSDAATIARGLMAACRAARVQAFRILLRERLPSASVTDMEIDQGIDAQHQNDFDYVTAFVLARRVKQLAR